MADPFVHLHVASGYSLQYGASHPHVLVERAAEQDMDTLALTDRDGTYGAVRFVKAAMAARIRPILGVDLAFSGTPGTPMGGFETVSDASSSTTGAAGELVLASWKQLIDDGRMQDGDEAMRATARKPVVLVGSATLARLGAKVGDMVTLTGPLGSVELPVGVADLAEGTVWAPASAPGASVRHLVGPAGCAVTITGGSR